MENMAAFTPYWSKKIFSKESKEAKERTKRTVISRHLASWAAAFVGHPAYAAYIALGVVVLVVAGVPLPLSNCMPGFDVDFHRDGGSRTRMEGIRMLPED